MPNPYERAARLEKVTALVDFLRSCLQPFNHAAKGAKVKMPSEMTRAAVSVKQRLINAIVEELKRQANDDARYPQNLDWVGFDLSDGLCKLDGWVDMNALADAIIAAKAE